MPSAFKWRYVARCHSLKLPGGCPGYPRKGRGCVFVDRQRRAGGRWFVVREGGGNALGTKTFDTREQAAQAAMGRST